MKKKIILILFSLIFLLQSCGKSSLDDYQEEGIGITRSLVQELRKIKNLQQLNESALRLENLFNELVDVIIEAHEFQQNNGLSEESVIKNQAEMSHKLRKELNRLYQIEGGRQMIEKIEEPALQRLSLYKKRNKIDIS